MSAKSTSTCFLKLVNPSISSLIGRMKGLLIKRIEEFCQPPRWLALLLLFVVLLEDVFGVQARDRWGLFLRSWILQADLKSPREDFVDCVRNARYRALNIDRDAKEGIAKLACPGFQFIQRARHIHKLAAGLERKAFNSRRPSGMGIYDDHSLLLSSLPEIELKRRAGVPGRRGSRNILGPMQVAECNVMRGRWKPLARNRIGLSDMDFTLAAASLGAIDVKMRHQKIDSLGRKGPCEQFEHRPDVLCVLLVALHLRAHQLRGIFILADRYEGQHGDFGSLSLLCDLDDPTSARSNRLRPDV